MNVNPIEMQNSLDGVNYPASKKQIIDQAKPNGASQEVRKALGALPEKEYDSRGPSTRMLAKEPESSTAA